jgi:hypothetical protein
MDTSSHHIGSAGSRGLQTLCKLCVQLLINHQRQFDHLFRHFPCLPFNLISHKNLEVIPCPCNIIAALGDERRYCHGFGFFYAASRPPYQSSYVTCPHVALIIFEMFSLFGLLSPDNQSDIAASETPRRIASSRLLNPCSLMYCSSFILIFLLNVKENVK